MNMIFLFDTF